MDAMKEAKAAVSGLSSGGGNGSGEYETTLASRIVRAVANMDEGDAGELNIGRLQVHWLSSLPPPPKRSHTPPPPPPSSLDAVSMPPLTTII